MRSASLGLGLGLALLAAGIPGVRADVPPHTMAPRPSPRATPVPAAATDARPLIVQAVAAPKHVSFVGQMSTIRSGTSQALAVISKIEHRAPDDTRRTYLAPRALYGQFVISRGAMSWDVDPSRKRVVVTENKAAVDPVAVVDDIALLDSNYRAVRTASDDVADRHADVIDLVSRYTGERAMRLWIDRDTHIVLAKEAYHSDGSLAWRTRFDDIRYTDDIPAEVFNGSVPPGYETVQGRSYGSPTSVATSVPDAGFAPVTPKYLPEGFSLAGSDVSSVKGTRNLHLIYSDGIRTLSLFENATDRAIDFSGMQTRTTSFEGHDARYVRDGPTTLLAWRERKLAFALVGDLDLKELIQIASSVVP
ncbi:outer membrane lipoprotein-sorting protein [Vulcanimicrobium alpinum]|uniref:Outer membrane lipoprotein-sorting protein n=1 Tax=Vulcanimicrobium alpinum TaxID=3016050 RepID=A0AAN1XX14_UNVUL|nr:sigma-E factor regulatory protein RseB domain-containing protein [Vulcanimicrobium alpinum]BDE06932.1 outer membrane lipoprotein-sorting protein [Vulcanimicrobium alpinum]